MKQLPPRLAAVLCLALFGAACQPVPEDGGVSQAPNGPAYAPDDPCKGVVPQLCAY